MSMRDDTRSTIQTQRQYEHDVQQDDDNKDCIRLQNQICSIWISATRPSYGGQSALAVPTTVPGALHSLCFISYSLCLLECTLLAAMWSLQDVDRMTVHWCESVTDDPSVLILSPTLNRPRPQVQVYHQGDHRRDHHRTLLCAHAHMSKR